jgi:hypothetical protein
MPWTVERANETRYAIFARLKPPGSTSSVRKISVVLAMT